MLFFALICPIHVQLWHRSGQLEVGVCPLLRPSPSCGLRGVVHQARHLWQVLKLVSDVRQLVLHLVLDNNMVHSAHRDRQWQRSRWGQAVVVWDSGGSRTAAWQ